MARFNLLRFDRAEELAEAAAAAWLERIQAAQRENTPQYVALSGGRIARAFLSCAAGLAAAQEGAFANTHFFWADERCVPPDHNESNFGLVNRCLFSRIDIPSDFIHRVPGEAQPAEAARKAGIEMKTIVPRDEKGLPVLSLVILGMGEDGHVASLFPGGPVLCQAAEVYLPISAPKPPPFRVTLSYSVIYSAKEVFVLASGPGKQRALEQSLAVDSVTPLGRVLGVRKQTTIWTDITNSVPGGRA